MWIPVVDWMSCVGCGKCAEACPEDAIAMLNKKATVDYAKCTCCGVCDRICQTGALELKIPQTPAVLEKRVHLDTLKAEVKMLKHGLKGMRKEVRRF